MRETALVNENAMAGKNVICSHLLGYYRLSAEQKEKHLLTEAAIFLFSRLPLPVANMLRKNFLEGNLAPNIIGWQDTVVKYFQENSRIIPALTKNPGTFKMLEQMYGFEQVNGVVDKYFLMTPAGKALYNRYHAINDRASPDIAEILQSTGKCLMIDIGSGPARNAIDICMTHPEFNGSIKIDCIDIDPEALQKGQELVTQYGVKQVEFVRRSMTKLEQRYPGNVDYGILIGILCGLNRHERVSLLSLLRAYFRKGAKLVAASLVNQMAEEDLLCAYILRETTGWGLQYPPIGELKGVFEEAGWKWDGSFQEEPTKFYEIGVGVAE
jgi:hypothetical protein